MQPSVRCAAALLLLSGCTFAIKAPAKNSTVNAPVAVELDYSANVSNIELKLDGQRLPFYAAGTLFCPAPGPHVLDATGSATGIWPYAVSASAPFSVGGCPLCFSCGPGAQQDAATCRCCQGGSCDALLYANFGPFRHGTPGCTDQTAKDQDCINQNCLAICGSSPAGGRCTAFSSAPEAAAVAFTPAGQVRLTWILLALSHQQGANAYQVSIAEDAGGLPGTTLESISLSAIPSWNLPVTKPVAIRSATQPTLQANRRYWLVVSPAATDTIGCWNFARADTSDGTNQSTNSAPGFPAGSWSLVPAGPYNLRPAFEVDGR